MLYCPYCAEETLFPIEGGGWECRSCQRAFSVKFLGLRTVRISGRPSMSASSMSTVIDLSQVAAQANRELADASAAEIMTWAYEEFGTRLVVTSSLADTVMVHLAEQAAPGIDVIFLDTGYHFAETIGTRDAVAAVHNVNLINITPKQTVAEQDATWGKDLFARNPDQCCALRKVAPLDEALDGYVGLGQRRPARGLTGAGRRPRSSPGTCAAS